MWDGKITDGAAQLLLAGKNDAARGCFLQVVMSKNIVQPSAPMQRLRITLSDGKHKISAVLATQVCNKVAHIPLDGAIVKINEFQLNDTRSAAYVVTNEIYITLPRSPMGGKILLVTNMDIISERKPIIGNPVDLQPAGGAGAKPAAPVSSVPPVQKQPVFGAQSHQAAAQPPRPVPPAAAHYNPPAAAAQYNAPVHPYHQAAGDGEATAYGQDIDTSRPASSIAALNPYSTSNWTIKARVTNKTPIRPFKSAKDGKDGKLFSVELVDVDGEIRATGFGQTVDNLYPVFQVGKVYYISKGDVKTANKKYTGNINNNYEITFNHNTSAKLAVVDEGDQLPLQHYHFVRVKELPEVGVGNMADICGIILEMTELTTKNTKNGDAPYRVLTIGDQSKHSVQLTLWAAHAERSRDWTVQSVVAVKGAKIGDFGGISLSVFASSNVDVNPDVPEALQVRSWFESADGQQTQWTALTQGRGRRNDAEGNQNPTAQNFNKWMTFAEANKIQPGGAPPESFWAYVHVSNIKHDAQSNWSYPACPKCSKKMTQNGAEWECHNEKCRMVAPAPLRRYTLQIALVDHTGIAYTTAFNEVGEKVLGMKADDLHQMMASGSLESSTTVEHTFQNALIRMWKAKLTPKFEDYQQKLRLKLHLADLEAMNYSDALQFVNSRIEVLNNAM